jgi:hypothetical protein
MRPEEKGIKQMTDDTTDDCLHCILFKVIAEYDTDVATAIEALADVIADTLAVFDTKTRVEIREHLDTRIASTLESRDAEDGGQDLAAQRHQG